MSLPHTTELSAVHGPRLGEITEIFDIENVDNMINDLAKYLSMSKKSLVAAVPNCLFCDTDSCFLFIPALSKAVSEETNLFGYARTARCCQM